MIRQENVINDQVTIKLPIAFTRNTSVMVIRIQFYWNANDSKTSRNCYFTENAQRIARYEYYELTGGKKTFW